MKQINSNRPKAMDKETFMQQYVLNRALSGAELKGGRCYGDEGEFLAKEAIRAWNEMQDNL